MTGLSGRITTVRGNVFAYLIPGELRLTLLPGVGQVNGGAAYDVPTDLIPAECRLPNSPLWVTVDLDRGEILKREPRESGESS
jgi:hypothetical protein